MKAISARIRGATSELADMGEEFEDVAHGMSKYRDEIMAITNVTGRGGFDIMKDAKAGEYKDIYDIFVGLAGVWNQLSGTGQARLSEILGGTKQLQVVSSIMNNIADATGAYGDALDSTGSLAKDYEKQLDSISGKLGILKANFQELSTTILDSELVKFGVDSLSKLTSALTIFTDKAGIAGVIAFTLAIKKLGLSLESIKKFSLLGSLQIGWNKLKIPGKIGLIIEGLTVLNSLLKAMGIDVFEIMNDALKTSEERIHDLTDAVAESNNEFKSISKEAESFAASYASVIDRYAELAKFSGEFNAQGELNDDEYKEFLDLQNQIAELFPDIDLGIDSNGNHILNLASNVDTLKESYDEMRDARLAAFRTQQVDEFKAGQEDYEKLKREQEIQKRIYQEQLDLVDRMAEAQVGDVFSVYGQYGEDVQKAVDQLGILYEVAEVGRGGIVYRIVDVDAVSDNLEDTKTVINSGINAIDYFLKQEEAKRAGILSSLIGTDPQYYKLTDELQNAVRQIVGQLDYESLFAEYGGDLDEIGGYLGSAILQPLLKANIGEKITSVISGEIDETQFAALLSEAFSGIDDTILNALITYLQLTGHAAVDASNAIEIFAGSLIDASDAGKDPSFENLISGIVKVKTEYQELSDLISKFKSKGAEGLDKKQYEELVRILPDLAVEFRIYNEEIQAAEGDTLKLGAAHEKMFNAMAASAKAYINTRIADGLKDVAEAANKFGADSYQAQHIMRELAEVAPNVVGALYDQTTGMYDLGDASTYSANSIKAFLQVQIEGKIASLKAQIDTLSTSFIGMSQSALIAAAAIATLSPGKPLGHEYEHHPIYGEYVGQEFTKEQIAAGQQIIDAQAAIKEFEAAIKDIASMDIPMGGGGGSAKTYADQVKEAFDVLNQSLENHVALQEEAFEKSKDLLNASGMREALARQVSYYTSMQREAKRAADAVREYYIKTGLSEQAAEQKKEVQELEKAYVDATKKVEDATDRMTQAIVEAFSSSVDKMQDVYKTLHDAADEYAATGYITVDTFQAIISQGVEYLALLKDENGQLVINEESIQKLISARVEQMTVETALSYVEALQAAKMTGNIEKLDQLLHATRDTTSATWGLVYASLELVGLTDEEKESALDVINSLRALSQTAISSIGQDARKTEEILKNMKKGVNDLLKYVMDMIKKNVELQIDALEEQKKKFSEIIDLKKKSLEMDRDEAKYQDKIAELTGKLAANQSRIDALSLVGTREAEAEKTKLLEEQQELQKELNELQADNALEQQKDSLDKMEEEYNEEKDQEIKDLEESISSKQKIYDAALKWIEDNWSTLHEKLLAWNQENGDAIASEITAAWEAALEAAKKYGSFTESIKGVEQDLEDVGQGQHGELGEKPDYKPDFTDEDAIRAIVSKMKYNSKNWFAFSDEEKKLANQRNKELAAHLSQYGVEARFDPATGIWYDQYGNELYKKYASYHTGGIVGDNHPNANEQFALLKNKEWVLSEKMVGNLTNGMKVIGKVSNLINGVFGGQPNYAFQGATAPAEKILSSITNSSDNHGVNITIGDTTITGADSSTLRSHQKISRDFLNELARQLGVKW